MQEAMTAELPVWVFGRCRWVSGVCRRTTCQDVLEAVLATPANHAPGKDLDGGDLGGGDLGGDDAGEDGRGGARIDPSAYVIVERWKGVERRLDNRVRILKVWSAWGEAQGEVQLLVRRVCEKGRHGAMASAAGARRHRKRSSKRPRPSPSLHDQPRQPRHPRQGQDDVGEVHRLMRLILAQGETIAGQLRRLREREAQIERLEAEAHREREEQHGKDYVLAAYLGGAAGRQDDAEDGEEDGGRDADKDAKDTPKTSRTQHGRSGRCGIRPRQLATLDGTADESDSERDARADAQPGVRASGPTSLPAPEDPSRDAAAQAEPHQDEPEEGDLGARIALWEKVVKVNKRLEQQEERLVRLYVGFRRSDPDGLAVDDRDQLRTSLARLEQDIAEGRRSMEANADLLTETDALLDAKRRLLRRLLAELEAADMDTARLMAARDAAMSSPPPASPAPPPPVAHAQAAPVVTVTTSSRIAASCGSQLSHLQSHTKGHDNDSNSDTGLSSLHSSSEEGVYILDTLV